MGHARYLIVALLLSGCGATPYYEGGVYHTVTETGSHNPAFIGGLGLEWDRKSHQYQCEWVHYSHITEGRPWNNRPEPQIDTFGCNLRGYFGDKR